MKRLLAGTVLAAIGMSPSLFAQWPLYPSPGTPKGPDGRPNLSAPGPRTADGKPDLSGIWMRGEDTEPNGPPAGRPPLATFGNAGADSVPAANWRRRQRGRRSFLGATPAPISSYSRRRRSIVFRGYQRGPRVTAERLLHARRYPRRRPRRFDRATQTPARCTPCDRQRPRRCDVRHGDSAERDVCSLGWDTAPQSGQSGRIPTCGPRIDPG